MVATGPDRAGLDTPPDPISVRPVARPQTTTGKQIMGYAAEHLIPQTMELGGRSPNIFMADVVDSDDEVVLPGRQVALRADE